MSRLDFANARTGARRARLLGSAEVRDLLARPDLGARLEWLGRRGLRPRAPADVLEGPDPLGAAESALREDVRRDGLRLLAEAEGSRPRALLAAFLELEAPQVIRAVLRGLAAGTPLDGIAAVTLPTPELPVERIRALGACAGAEEVAGRLEAWRNPLGAALRSALPARRAQGPLPVEVALDRAAVARVRRACRAAGEDGRVLRGHLRGWIDVRNARTLLVLAGAHAGPDLFVAGGGRIDEGEFLRLGRQPDEVMRAAMGAVLLPGSVPVPARPWAAERAMERALVVRLRREARARPLSLAVPLAYLSERRAEARAIAVTLRGAELGLPAEEILEMAEV